MRFQTLSDWLQWQEQLHPRSIDLGLARVREVWRRLHAEDFSCPVITVGGTNGKGSCVAMLEAIYGEAGYAVVSYTSPHLWRYNERIRINGEAVSDAEICTAFDRVDTARRDTSLTYFEFGTLAALEIFKHQSLDIILLEVGLGGRLDAVNIIDADVAIIASIDIDHTQWLGNDRPAIAREKAGILRPHNAGIVADPDPPLTLLEYAQSLGTRLYCLGRDFELRQTAGSWSWYYGTQRRVGLPQPSLSGEHQMRNAAAVLMALEILQQRLPVTQAQVRHGLLSAQLPGRFQVVPGEVTTIYDVAHNPAAAGQLAHNLMRSGYGGKLHTVFSALADKDIEGLLAPLCALVQHWYLAPLDAPRAATIDAIREALQAACPQAQYSVFATLTQALDAAGAAASRAGSRLVYGSFYTVAQSCPPGL